MKRPSAPFLFFIVMAVISVFYLAGVSGVPFHPDESTQLFTSGDFERFWRNPASLAWPSNATDPVELIRERYRLLDAPLTRNLIAVGRLLANEPALAMDWDWSKSWDENRQAGALPSQTQLMAGRLAIAALFPFSMLLLYFTVRLLAGEFAGWTASLLLAGNALVLLHTRRSMAEGALLFTTILTLWTMLYAVRRPWLNAVPAALAFCAKQSLIALAPVSFLAALWPQSPWRLRNYLQAGLAFLGVFALIVALLNPFVWKDPIGAARAAVEARQALVAAQTGDRPDQALDTPAMRVVGLLGSLYFTPPMLAEASNYQDETAAADRAYLANPLHSLLRSLPGGGLLLLLGVFGMLAGIVKAVRPYGTPVHPRLMRRRMALMLLATLVQTAALLALVHLPWQRYYVPLVPFSCLWSAYGLDVLTAPLRRRLFPDK